MSGAVASIALTVSADLAGHQRLMTAARRFLGDAPISREAVSEMMIIMDELTSNILRHAWPEAGAHEFDVSLSWEVRNQVHMTIAIKDTGVAFDPNAATEADRQSELDRRRPGGLGIALVRSLCDEIRYSRVEGVNSTVVLKSTAVQAG